MKILNRKQFLALPSGVLYSEYRSSGMVEGLYQKGDSWSNDWLYVDLLGEVDSNDSEEFHEAFERAENGEQFKLVYDCGRRDGAFEDETMFMVYDRQDIQELTNKLHAILAVYPSFETTE